MDKVSCLPFWVCPVENENLFRQTESQIAERVKAVQEAAAGQNRKISELARVIQVSKIKLSLFNS